MPDDKILRELRKIQPKEEQQPTVHASDLLEVTEGGERLSADNLTEDRIVSDFIKAAEDMLSILDRSVKITASKQEMQAFHGQLQQERDVERNSLDTLHSHAPLISPDELEGEDSRDNPFFTNPTSGSG